MNCDTCQYEINDLVDNELSALHKLKVQNHLSECAQCNDKFILIKSLKSQMVNQTKPSLSHNFEHNLHHKLKKSKYEQTYKPLFAIAASFAACFIIGYLFIDFKTESQNLNLAIKPKSKPDIHLISENEFNKATNIAEIDPKLFCSSASITSSCISKTDSLEFMIL